MLVCSHGRIEHDVCQSLHKSTYSDPTPALTWPHRNVRCSSYHPISSFADHYFLTGSPTAASLAFDLPKKKRSPVGDSEQSKKISTLILCVRSGAAWSLHIQSSKTWHKSITGKTCASRHAIAKKSCMASCLISLSTRNPSKSLSFPSL